ncbi:hypothetical protein YC2023_088965 [Brassica napus]
MRRNEYWRDLQAHNRVENGQPPVPSTMKQRANERWRQPPVPKCALTRCLNVGATLNRFESEERGVRSNMSVQVTPSEFRKKLKDDGYNYTSYKSSTVEVFSEKTSVELSILGLLNEIDNLIGDNYDVTNIHIRNKS